MCQFKQAMLSNVSNMSYLARNMLKRAINMLKHVNNLQIHASNALIILVAC